MSTSDSSSASSTVPDFTYAPPAFEHGQRLLVPISITGLTIHLAIDVAQERVMGTSRVTFALAQSGCPFFDLVPDPVRLLIDGTAVEPSRLPLVRPADNVEHMRFLDVELDAEQKHVLEVEYPLQGETVIFADGGVRLGLFLNDLATRSFLERYAPANLEFDQSPLSLSIQLSGATSDHRLFANGLVHQITANAWRIDFPDYFTCSSSYVHLTNRLVAVAGRTFAGEEGPVPVTVYGSDAYAVNNALALALPVMAELEAAYGPYAHREMLIYIVHSPLEPSLPGMEYCGATMTNLRVLSHEITHSWFGRGVMPANGNAGWIDEAIATWRDYSYVRASGPPNRSPANLAGFSRYRRDTTRDAYRQGMLLMSELDFLLRDQGGLRPVLSALYLAKRRQIIDTLFFQQFLEQQTGLDLAQIFARYVYGQGVGDANAAAFDALRRRRGDPFSLAEFARAHNLQPAPIPRPFRPEELRRLV